MTPQVQRMTEGERALLQVERGLDLLMDVATPRDSSEGASVFALISLGHALNHVVELAHTQPHVQQRLGSLAYNHAPIFSPAVEWAEWDSRQTRQSN